MINTNIIHTINLVQKYQWSLNPAFFIEGRTWAPFFIAPAPVLIGGGGLPHAPFEKGMGDWSKRSAQEAGKNLLKNKLIKLITY